MCITLDLNSPSCRHIWWALDMLLVLLGSLPRLVSIHRMCLFNNNLQGLVVTFGGTWIGPIHVHLDALHFWYTLRVLLFVLASFRARIFPSVWTVIFWHHWRILAWLFCHNRSQNIIFVIASSSAPIVSVLTYSSLNDDVIFGYTLQTVHIVFFTFSCNARHRIASRKWMKLRKRSWFCWYQYLTDLMAGPDYMYLPFKWVASGFLISSIKGMGDDSGISLFVIALADIVGIIVCILIQYMAGRLSA